MFFNVSDIPIIANFATKEKNKIERKAPKKNKIVVIT